jgi:Cytochrome P450
VKANGTASHSLLTDCLSQPHVDGDEDIMKAVALTGYIGKNLYLPGQNSSINGFGFLAGMETVSRHLSSPDSWFDVRQTASVLHTFLLAMVLYPDVQALARAEIDQVVRHNKMPCLNDRASLPYIDAILREVMRWYPPAPLGLSAVI